MSGTKTKTQRKKFTEFLPSTPCTPEMRSQIVEIAGEQGRSVADVQRNAFAFFLQSNYSKTIEINSCTIELEATP